MKLNYKGAMFTFIAEDSRKYNVTITTNGDRCHNVVVYEDGKEVYSETRDAGHANKTMALTAIKRMNQKPDRFYLICDISGEPEMVKNEVISNEEAATRNYEIDQECLSYHKRWVKETDLGKYFESFNN